MSLRFGYGLNGFTDHRLEDALALLADLGYDGVALTLDHAHLDPFAPDLPARTARVAALLERHGLGVVVETGARYVLDPRRKHEPTLVSASGRERRIDLLKKAVRVAAEVGSPAVSFWSGIAPSAASSDELWARVEEGVTALLPLAEAHGVDLALEPEPGMFVERISDVLELRRRLGNPDRLRLTVDVGHLRCTEDADPAACVLGAGDLVANVQIDDMRRGVHEHLAFGEGEVDFPPVLAALAAIEFDGLVAVELPRHSHAAPTLAAASLDFLRDAERRAQVASDPDAIERHFPAAARVAAREGRDGDEARAALLLALPAADVVTRLTRLYEHGDAAERRAVLLALPALDDPDRPSPIGDAALPVVRDALRTNDTRLVAAALGPYAATHLDDDAWRQAVLKVLFTGIPVEYVAGLAERADGELARMVRDFAAEREAAGRVVPPDARTVLALAEAPRLPANRPHRAD